MYHDKDSGSSESGSDSGDEGTEDLDESTGPNETVFLVYLYVSVSRIRLPYPSSRLNLS
jgi:hypothetical protein